MKKQKTRSDTGMGEVASMVFIIPLLVGLLFTMVEVSMYLHMRSQVENVINTATSGAARDGGNNWARTNTLGRSWDNWASEQVTTICGQRCEFAPPSTGVICTPEIVENLPYVQSPTPNGTDTGYVECQATIKFNPLTGPAMMNGPLGFGIGKISASTLTIGMRLPAVRSLNGFGYN